MTMNVQKTVVYAATQAPLNASMSVEKVTAYAAVQIPPSESLKVEKAVVYAATQTNVTGDAKQPTSAERPRYRTGAVPFVEFTAGSSLKINVLFPGVYTYVVLKPDLTIETQSLTLPAGPATLPTVNFNQAVLYYGVPDFRTLRRIKVALLARAP